MTTLQIPTTGLGHFIMNLASDNDVVYTETPMDRLANTITQLSDDDVQMDTVEQLLLALERASIIPREYIVQIHVNYLREKYDVRPI